MYVSLYVCMYVSRYICILPSISLSMSPSPFHSTKALLMHFRYIYLYHHNILALLSSFSSFSNLFFSQTLENLIFKTLVYFLVYTTIEWEKRTQSQNFKNGIRFNIKRRPLFEQTLGYHNYFTSVSSPLCIMFYDFFHCAFTQCFHELCIDSESEIMNQIWKQNCFWKLVNFVINYKVLQKQHWVR